MTTFASTLSETKQSSIHSRLGPALVLFAVALLIVLLFGFNSASDQQTTFALNLPSYQADPISDLTLPVQESINLLTLALVIAGVYQLARGFRSIGTVAGIIAFCFVAAFLLWAARGKSFSLIGMLSSALVRATPIALAALCGVICERAGVINIGIEGIMLFGALTAVVAGSVTQNLYIALLAAVLIGGLVGAFHALLVIRFKVDHTISGVALNIFATGFTSFVFARFLEHNDTLNNSGILPLVPIPLLSKIPVLGPIFFENNLIVYLAILLVVFLHVLLYRTRWGLRTRAVGEHPKAADTLGVDVYLTKYINVILGGMIAGIGGAYFTIGSVGRFDEVMTAGKGFIGLAAMISGNWNPIGAYMSSLIFGFADSLQVKLQILRVPIASEFLLMAPYIITMIVMTGVVGRATAPAADGQHYEK
ncbi:MAG: ABC transporter permease [Anaerolineales bacterium]